LLEAAVRGLQFLEAHMLVVVVAQIATPEALPQAVALAEAGLDQWTQTEAAHQERQTRAVAAVERKAAARPARAAAAS
jgi:hypothetical protein